MQTAASHTNRKCAYVPCNCDVVSTERFCSDHCEEHAKAPREESGSLAHTGACGCGHPSCGTPAAGARA